MKKILFFLLSLILATSLWLPSVHLLFRPDLAEFVSTQGLSPVAEGLFQRQAGIWRNPSLKALELKKMRSRNPEWDFMSRTYLVLALANIALQESRYTEVSLEIIDLILDNTLDIEQKNGFQYFLMKYGQGTAGWKTEPPQSLFVNGEIALMLCARRLVQESEKYRRLSDQRVAGIQACMERSDTLCSESYPDECWIFCNSVALAAIKMHGVLSGEKSSRLIMDCLASMKKKLIDRRTGILISAFHLDGSPAEAGPGPEGTSIWMACKMLELVDPAFARDQYRMAKKYLARSFLGFGYSREWPEHAESDMDIDSGPVIPVLGLSASASGLAMIPAAAFDDREYLSMLLTSLQFMGFPEQSGKVLRYAASNPVGDSVLLYALVQGPLWKKARSLENK